MNNIILDRIAQLTGHVSKEEGQWLFQTAGNCNVLEIGCFRGKSTAYIASAARSVVCCDGFCGQKNVRPDQTRVDFKQVKIDFEQNLKALGLYEKIRLYPVISELAFDEIKLNHGRSFHLMFIDGGHDELSVTADVKYSELLVEGGVIAFHDYHDFRYPDVKKVVDKWSSYHLLRINRISKVGTIQAYYFN